MDKILENFKQGISDGMEAAKPVGDGGPAFPFQWWDIDSLGENKVRQTFSGMSLRDWFAGMALQGFCSTATAAYEKGPCNSAIIERSFILADAMLKARGE